MSDLLIHSMTEFSDIILPALDLAGARNVVEIGAEFGGMSALLADACAAQGGRLISIDPSPKPEFLDWATLSTAVEHIALPSLEAIPQLHNVDAWVIDGDHNWYTVYHELKLVCASARRDGKPILAFLHDIGWPAGRRDMYYAPDRIPAEHRQPYSYDGGIKPGISNLQDHGGFQGMGQFASATHEGGPRNGVLSAVEEFLSEEYQDGIDLGFAEIPGVFGLGVVFDLQAEWSGAMSSLLVPYHQNKLLASLEQNRLANWLRVIELQANT